MIQRSAKKELVELSQKFKALAIIGPRQSGKTTLSRYVFPEKPYVSLENPDIRSFAENDPRGFLAGYKKGAIFDEAQRVPQLFSYLQQILDENDEPGQFIITGSNNFLLQENISQSLAGRVAYITLLPFSIEELQTAGLDRSDINEMIYYGGYPPIYDRQISPDKWFPNYIRTYIERDVRQIKNIENLGLFERFIRLCAGRTGQLLNLSNLAIECGVDHKTISSWIHILENSFIIYLLRPHYKNFNKRMVKMPKLYFYDTGLACALLGIQHAGQIFSHPLRGSLFENFVVSELLKNRYNSGLPANLYFWRTYSGNEIDILIDRGTSLYPIEIKSGQTVTEDYFREIKYWNDLNAGEGGSIIYGGEQAEIRSDGIRVIPWKELHKTGL